MGSKITQDAVWELASQLAAEGHNPTQKLIQSQLGGSMRDIVPHLRSWREANVPQKPRIIIDDALTKALQAMADRHSAAMETLCKTRVAAMQQEMDEALAEAESMQQKAIAAIKENEALTKQMIDKHNKEMKDRLEKAKAIEAKYEKTVKIDEQLRGQIVTLKDTGKRQERQLAQAQAEIVSLTSRAAAAEATAKALQAQLDSLLGKSTPKKTKTQTSEKGA